MTNSVIHMPTADAQDPSSFCLTPTAAQIIRVLEFCQQRSELGVIIGSPGVGKTTTFLHHVAELRNHREDGMLTHRARMVTMTGYADKPIRMLMMIAKEFDWTYQYGWSAKNHGEVYEKLCQSFRPGDVFIVDEAQHLPDSALEILRGIYDQCGFGLVLGANATVLTRGGKRRAVTFGQFLSRIGIKLDLDGSLPEDAEAFFDHHQVQGARTRALLARHVTPAYGLRMASKIIVIAHEASGSGRPIELKHVEAAIEFLGLRA